MISPSKFDGVQQIKYDAARSLILPADILLFSGTSFYDNLIQQGTSSMFSHCGMAFWWGRRLMIVEAEPGVGVRAYPLSDKIIELDGRCFLGRAGSLIGLTHDQENEILSSATNFMGRPYGTEEIAQIAIHLSIGLGTHRPENALICSEYVALCFKEASILFTPESGDYWYPSTIGESILISPIMEILP